MALGATVLLQTAISFGGQALPVVAPMLRGTHDLPPEAVGYAVGLLGLGTALTLAVGAGFIDRIGPIRSLQLAAVIAAMALASAGIGSAAILLPAALALGLASGPGVPAAGRVLAATTPPRRLGLLFSVNRSGVPLGGILAGLCIPMLSSYFGIHGALLAGAAFCLAAALLTQPTRGTLDHASAKAFRHRPMTAAQSVFKLRSIHPLLSSLIALSSSLAALQSCVFTFAVSFLIEVHAWHVSAAGILFATMQLAGIASRLILGWLADRTRAPRRLLLAVALAATLSAAILVLLPVGAPAAFLAVAAVGAGFATAAWNGVALAEAARLSPATGVAAVTARAALFVLLAAAAAPPCFSFLVATAGGWRLPMLLAAGQALVCVGMLSRRLAER